MKWFRLFIVCSLFCGYGISLAGLRLPSHPAAGVDHAPLRSELVFVDSRVENHRQLLSTLSAQPDGHRSVDIHVLDAQRDGMVQISEVLARYRAVDAVHILSHGTDGAVQLGNSGLRTETLPAYAALIQGWRTALAKQADLLFYGCDLAGGEPGQRLLNAISALTGADVAASVNRTGHANLGGDWNLEFTRGRIDTAVVVNPHVQSVWSGLLAVFIVSNTNDTGPGSLRQAITNANVLGGLDIITFLIPLTDPNHYYYQDDGVPGTLTTVVGTTLNDLSIGDFDPDYPVTAYSWYTITPGSALPDITNPVIIDGMTQPGYINSPVIELDGSAVAANISGLRLTGTSITIRRLVINRFTGHGLVLSGNSSIIEGNYIGLDVSGSKDFGNDKQGIQISNSSGNRIGGTTLGAGNVISGNSWSGVSIQLSGSNDNLIQGNLIGTDATGTIAIGNSNYGVDIWNGGPDNNRIGGSTAAARNIIAGNAWECVQIKGSGTTGNTVSGNYIGTDLTGTFPIPCALGGIVIEQGATSNTIGGVGSGEGNVIAFNSDDGIKLENTSTDSNAILGNNIFSNSGLGIDLDADGVTANDLGDGDGGANSGQNFPVLTSANTDGAGNLYVGGIINSSGSRTFRIEVFANSAADPSGYGEGETYLGFTSATTASSGNGAFSVLLSATVPVGTLITATATDLTTNDTSEFSLSVTALDMGQLVVDTTGDIVDAPVTTSIAALLSDRGADDLISLREAIRAANGSPNGGTPDEIRFNIPHTDPNHFYYQDDSTAGLLSIVMPTQSDDDTAIADFDPDYPGPFHSWYRIVPSAPLDAITDAVILDATTQPNFVGSPVIELDGNVATGGDEDGLTLQSGNSTVSGFAINQFGSDGIEIEISGNNTIEGNYIGTDITGTLNLGNTFGISVKANNNVIGGSSAFQRNIVSGNTNWGVAFYSSASGNDLKGNYIGTDVTGAAVLGNGGSGVHLYDGAANNTLGGTSAGEENIIAYNANNGIALEATAGNSNAIRGNSIHSNTGLGIDLLDNGLVDFDDLNDVDTGPNQQLNSPDIGVAVSNEMDTITIDGSLQSLLNTDFDIDFFYTVSNPDQGQVYLGTVPVSTEGTGNASFDNIIFTPFAIPEFAYITATATVTSGVETGNTSEFSEDFGATVANQPPVASIAPASYAVSESVSLSLESAGLAVGDPDSGARPVRVTLSVGEGILTVNDGTTGVSVSGSGSNVVTLDGTVNQASDVLAGNLGATIDYAALEAPSPSTILTLLIDDLGNTGSGGALTDDDTATLNITAENDDPSNTGTLPTDVVVTEDVASQVNLTGIDLSDVDADTSSLTVTLSTSSGGTLVAATSGGVTVSGSGTGTLTLTGTLAALNPFLDDPAKIQYTSASNAYGDDADSLTIDVTDNGNTGTGGGGIIPLGSVNVDITAVGDTPSVTHASTAVDTQTTSGLVISRHVDDGPEVTHFRISNITDGTLYHNDGSTVIASGSYITFAEGNAGLKFTPLPSSTATGSFGVESSEDGTAVSSQSGVVTATITVTLVMDGPLLLTTNDDVTGGGQPGVDTWRKADLVQIANPNLAVEPSTTNGTFSVVASMNAFVSGNNINAIHYVSTNIQVGTSNFQLYIGDLLLASQDASAFGALAVSKEDVVVFHPDTPGDYSAGTFTMLLKDPAGAEIHGISLIEKDTVVGDASLQAGDFLFTRSGGAEDSSVWLFETTDVGATSTSGTASVLLAGDDDGINIAKKLFGVDLMETTTMIGSRILNAGTILLAIDSGDDVGTNEIAVTKHDIFALDVTNTTFVSGDGNGFATASLFFKGGDVAFESGDEEIDGLTLTVTNNSAPMATNLNAAEAYTEDTLLNLTDVVITDADSPNATATLTLSDTSAGSLSTGTSGAVTSTYNVGTGLWSASGALADVNTLLAGVTYTSSLNYNSTFDINTSVDDGVAPAITGVKNMTGTPVGDTPSVTNASTLEDTQTTSGLVITPHAADSVEVTHFRISAITGGTLYHTDGLTAIPSDTYITVAEGGAGLKFTPSPNATTAGSFGVESSEDGTSVAAQSAVATATITISPVGDTPSVTNASTLEDTQTTSGLVITPHASDGVEVTHFRISAITGGTLYHTDGLTVIPSDTYITVAEGGAGLKFTPSPNATTTGSFGVESSEGGASVAAQSLVATATITITPVGDTPSVTNAITLEDTQTTSGLAITPHATDGVEVTHFRISSITGGTLYHTDGLTVIPSDTYITVAEGGTGLKFTPSSNATTAGSFNIESSEDGTTVAAQSAVATATITVTPVNDAPVLDNTGTITLTDVIEDNTNPPGNSVASIISSAGGDPITDIDSGAVEGIVVIGVDDTDGTWEYSTDGGFVWFSFVVSGVANGSTDDTSAVLLDDTELIRFVPNSSYTGPAGDLTFYAWDQSSGASGDIGVDASVQGNASAYSIASETATLSVVAISSVTNFVPGGQTLDEDDSLTLTTGTGNVIVVDDGSAADPVLQTSLSVSNGILNLATTTGLAFASGGDGTSAMTIVGLESAINTALDGLSYDPATDYHGAETLGITTSSSGGLLGHYSFDNIADPGNDDSPGGTNDGTVNGGTVPVFDAGRGGNVLPFDGTDDMVHIPGLMGSPVNVTLAAWVNMDAGFFSDELISLGDNVFIRLDESLLGIGVIGVFHDGTFWRTTASNIFIAGTGWHHIAYTVDTTSNEQVLYIDGAPVATDSYTGSIGYGLGTETYIGRHGTSPIGYFLHGKADDAMIFDYALSASEVATLFASGIVGLSDTDDIAITVTPVGDTPSVTNASTLEDIQTTSGLVISQHVADDAEVTHFRVSSITGGTLYHNDGSTVISSGTYITVAEGNAGLKFTPSLNSTTAGSFGVESSENGTTVAAQSNVATATISITPVNDAPSATNLSAGDGYTEDTPLSLTAIVITDVDSTNVTATLTLSDVTAGSLSTGTSGAVTSTYNAVTGVWSASGALGDVNTLLSGVTFAPAVNYNSSFTIATGVDDGVAPAITSVKTMTGTAVNDAPSATNLSAGESYTEDTPLGLTAIVISDVDNANVTATLTLSDVSAGSLSTGTSGAVISTYNAVTGVWSASGTLGDVNTLLSGLTFAPALNYNSSFTIATGIDDSVAPAITGVKAMTGTLINDVPSATNLSAGESYTEDTPLNLVDIMISDVDSANVTATLTVSDISAGSLSTGTSGAVTSTYDVGTGLWSASGALADVNTLLAGVTYTPALNYDSSFTIATSVDDGVAPAITGAKITTGTPINDAPSATNLSVAESYTEDTPINLTAIVISDVDSANVTATLTVSDTASGSLSTGTSGAVTSTYNVGTGLWSASGALTDVNTLLAGVTYTPALNYDSSFTIATSVDDGVSPAITGVKITTGTPINDAPSATNLSAAESYTEDTALNLIAIVISDVDSANVTATLTVSDVAAGSLSTSTSGSVTSTYNAGTGVWSASGALGDVSTLLVGVTYTPTLNYNSSFSIATSVDDGVAPAVTEVKSMAGTAINDAPSATNLSAAESYTEDTALNLIAIVISDVDSANVTATLTVSDTALGSLSTGTSGAVTSTYNAGTGVWSASGALADVNTLLSGVTYTPALNYDSSFTITTSVDDGIAPAITGVKVTTGTPINDAPSTTNLSAAETYTEDTPLNLIAIVITDVDSANVTATLTVSDVLAGSLSTGTSGAVTSTYTAGTGVWSASGALGDVNTLLVGVTYTPTLNYNSSFSINTSVDDGIALAVTGVKTMTGTAINDAPSATNLSAAESYTEDVPLNLIAIVITDVDSNNVTATLTVSDTASGSLSTGTSGAVTSTYTAGTGVWNASGALADVNTLLSGVVYTPALNYDSSFSIATSVADGVAPAITGVKTTTGTAINDAPSATNLSAAEIYTEDIALNLVDMVISDADSANVTATLTLSDVSAGSLNTGTSGSVTSTYTAGTGVWTASGALGDVNTLLVGVTYTPTLSYNSSFSIATSVDDGVAPAVTGVKNMTSIAVNNPPSATNLSTAESYTEDTALNLVDMVISDIDSPNVSATLTLSDVSAGSLSTGTSGAVTSTYNVGTGVWSASGALSDVNSLLVSVTYTPTLNYNSSFTIATSVTDGVAPAITGVKITTGTAINDAPSATNLSAAEVYNEDTPLNLVDMVISDVDSANVTATLTISDTASGSLSTGNSGSVTSTYTAGTGVWSASGALGDVNTLLAGVTYTPTLSYNNSFTIATSVDDGVAPAITGVKTMTGTAINNPPSATNLSAGEAYTEDTTLNLTAIVITDVDSANVTATLTLSDTSAGSLSTGTSGSVTSTYNAGTGVWTASGALGDVNTLLSSITYMPALNYNSGFSIATSVDDGVAPAITGVKITTGTPINDAPSATNLSAAESYTEDIPLTLVAIVITDVDSANVTATLTLSDTSAGSLSTGTSGSVTSTYNAGTGVWSASGALSDINTLLVGVTYTPTLSYNSNFTIATSVDDGVAPAVTGVKNMAGSAINDAPSATNLSAAESYTEDTPLALVAIVITDVDSANVTATLTLSDTASGSLSTGTSGAVTSTYNGGTGVWSASGVLADVNMLLSGVTYTPAFNYNSSFTIATSVDDGVASAITGVKITTGTTINDAPSATNLSVGEAYIEDTPLSLTAMVINDVDSANVTATLTLSDASAGSLSTGTSGSVTSTYNAGTGVWSASGALGDVNTLLASVTYTPALNYDSIFSIATSVDDGVAPAITGVKTTTGTPVGDTPQVANIATLEDTQSGAIVLDRNADDGPEVSHFKITGISGGILYQNDGVTVIDNGAFISVAQGNAGLKFTPTPDSVVEGSFTVQASTSGKDSGLGGEIGLATITVDAVNDRPGAEIAMASYAVAENTPFELHGTGLAVRDLDADEQSVQVRLSVGEGFLTAAAGDSEVTLTGSGTSTITLDGILSQVNDFLAGNFEATLVYQAMETPSASTVLTLAIDDQGHSGSGGPLGTTATATLTIASGNDAPRATIVPTSYAVSDHTPLVLQGTGLSVADPDAGTNPVRVTLTVGEGVLSVGAGTTGLVVTGSETHTVSFDGTLDQVNALLAGSGGATLVYQTLAAQIASTSLTLTIDDLGHSGSGGSLSASDSATLAVTAINDAPIVTIALAAYAATSTTPLDLHGTGLSVADPDAGVAPVRLTLRVGAGSLSVDPGTTGVTLTGSGTTSVTLEGTMAQLRELLTGHLGATMTYHTADTADTVLTLELNDLGATGLGSPLSDTATVAMTMVTTTTAPINHAPTAMTLSGHVVHEMTDTSSGYRVGSLSAVDPDTGDRHTYLVVGGNDVGKFSIGGTSLNELVLTNGILDFETTSSYSVTVRTTDRDGLSYDERLTITVTDIAPAIVTGQSFTVSEAVSGGTQVGTVATTGDTPQTFSITTGNVGDVFDIDANGVIRVNLNSSLNFDATSSYTLTIDLGDGSSTVSGTVTIKVTDVAEAAPVAVTSPSAGPAEPAPVESDAPAPAPAADVVAGEVAPAPVNPAPASVRPTPDDGGRERPSPLEAQASPSPTRPSPTPPFASRDRRLRAGRTTTSNRAAQRTRLSASPPASGGQGRSSNLDGEVSDERVEFNSSEDLLVAMGSVDFLKKLDDFRKDVNSDTKLGQAVIGSAITMTTGLSIGYVLWLVRGGLLLSSLLSSLPAWHFIDPLPILAHMDTDSDEESADDESLESMVQRGADRRGAMPGSAHLHDLTATERAADSSDQGGI